MLFLWSPNGETAGKRYSCYSVILAMPMWNAFVFLGQTMFYVDCSDLYTRVARRMSGTLTFCGFVPLGLAWPWGHHLLLVEQYMQSITEP